MTRRTSALLTLGVLGFIAALCAATAPYYSTILVWELRRMLPFLGALALLAVFVLAGGLTGAAIGKDTPAVAPRRRLAGGVSASNNDETLTKSDKRVAWFVLLGFGVGLITAITVFSYTQYTQDRSYDSATTVTTDPLPALAARAPYSIGAKQAESNLGDTTGDIAGTTYLPNEDRYSTLVKRRGWLAGYEVSNAQHLPLQGRGQAEQRCTFDKGKAADRLGGWFTHNLGREISKTQRWVRFNADDAYSYCASGATDGDAPVPMVVVPLKRQVGFFAPTERPAGVALYNGKTGELTITDDTRNVPGPSYPLSLAKQQREATAAMDGFVSWFWNRAGWETPDDATNLGNDSEFVLAAGGQPAYITPLTGRGSTTSISVVSSVPARHGGLRLAPMAVHKLSPVWVSPKAIADRVKADYQNIPNWPTYSVHEVIPTGGGRWVATIGTEENILHRVVGNGNLKGDKPTCLLKEDGSERQCGTLAGVNGNGIGTQYGPDSAGSPGPAPAPAPAGEMRGLTDAQLAERQRQLDELQRQLGAEVACRLDKTCTAG